MLAHFEFQHEDDGPKQDVVDARSMRGIEYSK